MNELAELRELGKDMGRLEIRMAVSRWALDHYDELSASQMESLFAAVGLNIDKPEPQA